MKRALILTLCALLLAIGLSLSAFAALDTVKLPSDFVGEGEFTIVSVHSMHNFISKMTKPEEVEDLFYGIADEAETLNTKFVSLVGQMGSLPSYYPANTIANGMTQQDMYDLSDTADTRWNNEFGTVAEYARVFSDVGIGYGVSFHWHNYYGDGYSRNSRIPFQFALEDRMSESIEYYSHDDTNFYVVEEVDGVKYMIFQLELWPTQAALDWFNTTMKMNTDKRAIIYTTSFIDEDGKMYVMGDVNRPIVAGGNTDLRGHNIANFGTPRDGNGIWEYAFKQWDNISAVITSYPNTGDSIVTSKITNPNGYEVVAVAANSGNGLDEKTGAVALLTKFSPNGEVTTCWYIPGEGYIKGTMKTVSPKIAPLPESPFNDDLPKIEPQYNGANNAYIFGYEDATFRPNKNMSRAEACTIFARLILGVQDIPSGYTTRFKDIKESDWFYNAVAFLDETGYFFRIDSDTYKPNEPITRAEFVDLAVATSTLARDFEEYSFKDVPETHFYYAAIVAAADAGIVNGYEDATFRPDNTITRAEVVTVINRLLNLTATDAAIEKSLLKNTFKDISKHWAENQVLVACNSNVTSRHAAEATLDGVVDTGSNIEISNDLLKLVINKKNGKVLEVITVKDGVNINNNTGNEQFIYINSPSGSKIVPSGIETDGNRLKVTFKNGAVAYLLVEVLPEYITFELDTQTPSGYAASITFANIVTNLPTAGKNMPDEYHIGVWAMNINTNTNAYAYYNVNSVWARAFGHLGNGAMGAKVALVVEKNSNFVEVMKKVSDATDRSVGLASHAGGPFAMEHEGNYGNYVIIRDADPAEIKKICDVADKYGIDQIDFHQVTGQTFAQGGFEFAYTENGTAGEFKETVGSIMEEAGVEAGLHTYAFYIAPGSKILANTKYHKDLEFAEDVYTLNRDISKNRKNLPTVEDASKFDNTYSFFYKNSRYVLVDEEIMSVGAGTDQGFVSVGRGACGTTATTHEAGAKIRHLTGYFNMLVPIFGSDLFWEIADRTAEAYNEGGFTMIYMDAIDGLSKHCDPNDSWYWFNAFTHRILSQCETDPVIEFSTFPPQSWNVRGRYGAKDTVSRGIQKADDAHVRENVANQNLNYTTTLGWYHFFPDLNAPSGMRNTIQKTLFHDDIDNLGYQAVIYNMSMSYNEFNPDQLAENPMYSANIEYYNYYDTIRRSGYFTKETLQKVIDYAKSTNRDFKIIEKEPGEYAFLEMYYLKNNVGESVEKDTLTFTAKNPLDAQEPFIRIESRYSTLGENGVLLVDLDPDKTLAQQAKKFTVKNVDMTEKMAIVIPVKGTGKAGDAAMLHLRGGISSGESGGRIDYLIDLNFEGWRDIVLVDADNLDYDTSYYKIGSSAVDYDSTRVVPNYADVTSIEISTCGTGNAAQFGDIMACSHIDAPVVNPTLTVGSSSITFNTTISGGEYLEYNPAENKAYVYHEDQSVTEVTDISGKFELPAGNFTCTYSGEAQTEAPMRAKIVFGLAGIEITN